MALIADQELSLPYSMEKTMTPQDSGHRWFAVCLSMFLGALSMNAATGAETLSGAQAQKSPQADIFLAYEKALLRQGIDAAGPYMTPKRLANMKDQLKQFGEDGFKKMQIERRKSTPQGEARRKQIEKVVVDGDSAVLDVRNGPNDVDQAPLAKTKDGWKVTTR
jgi:hypothetical protein